jgi:hypothetical protein
VRSWLLRLWTGWQVLGRAIGDFQARILLTVFYLAIGGLVGSMARLLGDPLRQRQPTNGSAWRPRKPPAGTLEDAGHQY